MDGLQHEGKLKDANVEQQDVLSSVGSENNSKSFEDDFSYDDDNYSKEELKESVDGLQCEDDLKNINVERQDVLSFVGKEEYKEVFVNIENHKEELSEKIEYDK